MSVYVRIDDGIVQEVILPLLKEDGTEWPIAERFPAEFVELLVDVTGLDPLPTYGWLYDGLVFSPPQEVPVDEATLAYAARYERDRLLNAVYDAGINMALRAVRMAATPEDLSYAEGKVVELDTYAEALIAIPDQPGFPQTIIWPTVPTR